MLELLVLGEEFYNEETQEFFTIGDTVLRLEHSLVSLSKWESKFQVPFLSTKEKTQEEISYYIQCMLLGDSDLSALNRLTHTQFVLINEYIDSAQSATTFSDDGRRNGRSERITSELIYYWMVAFSIPFEAETWHLNRLFSLIRICSVKNGKPKKMSRSEQARRNAELNAMRRKQLGTTG